MKKTSQKLEEKVIEMLERTTDSHSEIGRRFELSDTTVERIQDRAINEGLLDEKYRRCKGGTVKHEKDKVVELLEKSNYSLNKIGREVDLNEGTVKNIQNKAIEEGILDEKYRRLARGIIKHEEDKVVELLEKSNYSLTKIGREVGLYVWTIKRIQEKAIEEGKLDEKYRRLAGGIFKYQINKVVELLEKSNYSLNKIGREVGLSGLTARKIQNKAIKEGLLDEKYRRLAGGTVKYQKPDITSFLIDYARS